MASAVENVSAAYSGTTAAPHEYFDQTGNREWSAIDRQVADAMSSYWVNFAANGDPNGKGQVQFTIPDAGEYRVRVSAPSVQGREVESSTYIWASGGDFGWGMSQQDRIKMVADKPTYAPGDTAHVVIMTGKDPVSVLVTTEGNGLYSQQVVKSSGGGITVDVPIRPEYAPNFYVAAAFIRGNKFYSGSKSLKVPPYVLSETMT